MIPEERGSTKAQDGNEEEAYDGFKQGNAGMVKERVVGNHLIQIPDNPGGVAEKEAVDPAEGGGSLPKPQKEEQKEKPSESDPVVVPVVGMQERFLAGRGRRRCLMLLVSHRLIPPIID